MSFPVKTGVGAAGGAIAADLGARGGVWVGGEASGGAGGKMAPVCLARKLRMSSFRILPSLPVPTTSLSLIWKRIMVTLRTLTGILGPLGRTDKVLLRCSRWPAGGRQAWPGSCDLLSPGGCALLGPWQESPLRPPPGSPLDQMPAVRIPLQIQSRTTPHPWSHLSLIQSRCPPGASPPVPWRQRHSRAS